MHIGQQPNGKWRVIVQDEKRRRSKGGLATQRDARRVGAQLMIELGKEPKLDDATLADIIDIHLSTGTARAATTAEDYRYLLAKVPDWLMTWKVQAITPMMLDQAYSRLGREGMTAHRLRRLHGIIRPALDLAVTYGWITHSPAVSIRPPAKPASSVTAPDPADVIRILAAADQTTGLGCALRVAATIGLRRGELCALQWDDLNLTDRQLVIRRSVSTTTTDAHRITEGKIGKAGWRVVAVPATTMTALATHRAAQAAWLLGKGIGKTEWMFTADGQHPWRTDYLTLAFSRLRDELGLDLHLHQMRHYVATQLIGSGMDVKTVAGRLGHSRTSTTADTYAAFMPARDREAADIIERSLGG